MPEHDLDDILQKLREAIEATIEANRRLRAKLALASLKVNEETKDQETAILGKKHKDTVDSDLDAMVDDDHMAWLVQSEVLAQSLEEPE